MKATVGTAFITLCLGIGVGLNLLVDGAVHAQSALTVSAPDDETAIIRLRPGQLPEVRLSGALLHRLLVAEFAAQRDGRRRGRCWAWRAR